jgi:apolipoprotein D and lipocalin family protein
MRAWVWWMVAGCTAAEESAETGTPAVDAGPTYAAYADMGETVASVDPARYVGLWYEIATTGSFQQETCTATTATYTPIDETTIEVYNRCELGALGGPVNEITGTATAIDETFARLEVDFGFGFPAPYDIIELDGATGDAPYAFAGVSSFSGAQLWILARTPQIDPALYDALTARMDQRGFDASARLMLTEQPAE